MNPSRMVPDHVAKLLDVECAGPGGLLVALSGGVDSVALLSAVVDWANHSSASPRVEAFHMHHGLRGEEADRDSRHCFQVCYRLGIPIHVVHEDLDRQLGPGQPSLETLSRDKRRSHIEKVATSRNCPHVLLGHHADDQAETLLGNLLRGCGLKGLSGIAPCNPLGARRDPPSQTISRYSQTAPYRASRTILSHSSRRLFK